MNLINYLQTYDTRLRARASPQSISEEAQRRMKERKEWAEKQRQVSEKRMAEIKAQYEREKQAQEAAKIKRVNEATLVAEMLREMYRLNPEFAARREAVLQVRICFLFEILACSLIYLKLTRFSSARQNVNGQRCINNTINNFDLFDPKASSAFLLLNDVVL